MTQKDDPSGVAFGGNGNGGRDPSSPINTGNGGAEPGTSAATGEPFPPSVVSLPDLSKLGWEILDHLERGVIALDNRGHILKANQDARTLLQAGALLRARGGRLEFVSDALDTQLTNLLAALSLTSATANGFVARLRGSNNDKTRRILVTPMTSRAIDPSVAVLVYIFDTHNDRVISLDVLRNLYGLTAAQAAVTATLFEGHTVEETAQRLGLAVNTVRSHLKHIFTKCDVHTQSDLLHLLDHGDTSFVMAAGLRMSA